MGVKKKKEKKRSHVKFNVIKRRMDKRGKESERWGVTDLSGQASVTGLWST